MTNPRACPACGNGMRKIGTSFVEHPDGQLIRQALLECESEAIALADPLNQIRDRKPTTLTVCEVIR